MSPDVDPDRRRKGQDERPSGNRIRATPTEKGEVQQLARVRVAWVSVGRRYNPGGSSFHRLSPEEVEYLEWLKQQEKSIYPSEQKFRAALEKRELSIQLEEPDIGRRVGLNILRRATRNKSQHLKGMLFRSAEEWLRHRRFDIISQVNDRKYGALSLYSMDQIHNYHGKLLK